MTALSIRQCAQRAILVLLAAVTVLALPASANQQAALVVRTTGTVSVVDPDSTDGRALTRRDAVSVGQTVVTGNNSAATLRFSDNSLVDVRANTRLIIRQHSFDIDQPTGGSTLLEITEGGIRAVSGLIGQHNPPAYTVQTSAATIGIRGTEFEVLHSLTTGTDTAIFNGIVEVAPQPPNTFDITRLDAVDGPRFLNVSNEGVLSVSDNIPAQSTNGEPLNVPIPGNVLQDELITMAFTQAVLAAAPAAAAAQPVDDMARLRALVQQQQWAQARTLSSRMLAQYEGEPDFDFLYGLAALGTNNLDDAVFAFQRVIAVQRTNDRARLELGRTYFAQQRWAESRQQFERVRANNPPTNVRANVDRYLEEIDRREREALVSWKGTVSLTALYDSNAANISPTASFPDNSYLPSFITDGYQAPERVDQYKLFSQVDLRREARLTNITVWGLGVRALGAYTLEDGEAEFTDLDIGVRTYLTTTRERSAQSRSLEVRALSQRALARYQYSYMQNRNVQWFGAYEPSAALEGGPVGPILTQRLSGGANFRVGPVMNRAALSVSHNYNIRPGSTLDNLQAERSDTWSVGLEHRGQYAINRQFNTSLTQNLNFTRWFADDALFFDPDSGDPLKRADIRYTIKPGLSWQPNPNLITQGGIAWSVRNSNIDLYDYNEITADLGVALVW
ncbi:FecR domain-containing protein [Salinispirillum sp. LH 10-3-1]|uniref:FecR domain-containing protein n=1 Tax=Salinispirillum sp. LH 10-3-1 TaxID=2952525 RepID=A0AB38YDY5_9GAMM